MSARKEADRYAHARQNAKGWYESIADYAERLERADEGDKVGSAAAEAVREEIQESVLSVMVLSVMVRDGWRLPGSECDGNENTAEEFEILLSTGGPALRLWGKLGQHGEPESCEMQMQDWGIPWTRYPTPEDTLLAFARCFYFGEG